jgi:hypothetical protein
MSFRTPFANRLWLELDNEFLRMLNEWFFKWHHIKGASRVEIDSFAGRPICYSGISFFGSARQVYWDTIQRYLRNKVQSLFEAVEVEIKSYSPDLRIVALEDLTRIITGFAHKVRREAVKKDRILRGNGIEFPEEQDLGRWEGANNYEITKLAEVLKKLYCDIIVVDGVEMPVSQLLRDVVTFLKKDGTVIREDIPSSVQSEKIFVFDVDLPIEVGDKFQRKLPSGLIEEYSVIDPCFMNGTGSIKSHYQTKVKRNGLADPQPNTVINNFSGHSSRVNINSTDQSTNFVNEDNRKLFSDLRTVISNKISDPVIRSKALDGIDELEKASSKEDFKSKYLSFMAIVADHMSIVLPLLPALTNLL